MPSGYLKCNGAAVSRTTFADLFGLIGTASAQAMAAARLTCQIFVASLFVVGMMVVEWTVGATSLVRSQTKTKQHNHTATSTVTDPGQFHTTENFVVRANYQMPRNLGVGTDGRRQQ